MRELKLLESMDVWVEWQQGKRPEIQLQMFLHFFSVARNREVFKYRFLA